ncbi:hypothetical protein ACFWJH_33880, partial [Streptomyces lasiicapitis]
MNTAGHTDIHGLDLIPFRGVRYDSERVGSLAAVTSPPYDVVVGAPARPERVWATPPHQHPPVGRPAAPPRAPHPPA